MPTHTIIPAIIPQSFEHLAGEVATVSSFVKEVQVDIVDGRFVPYTSWPYVGNGALNRFATITEQLIVEADLMIQAPEDVIPTYLDFGVSSIVVHLESTTALDRICMLRTERTFLLGFSIGNDTPFELLLAHLHKADYVQLMGIPQIGAQGKPFDERVLERVYTLRSLYPELCISIDGSVNVSTLPLLLSAGANRFVSGSAIFNAPNPQSAYELLMRTASHEVTL